jgi:trans-aconitate methyltransferase
MSKVDLPFFTWKHNNWVNSYTIEQIKEIKPLVVYDAGVGDGFYGQLIRYMYPETPIHLVGIELNSKWLNHCQQLNIYTQLYLADIAKYLGNDVTGDLIIFGDVLEHLNKPEMEYTLEQAVSKFKWVIINGPVGFQEQTHEDPEELHRCGITKEADLSKYNIIEYHEQKQHMMNCLIKGKL